MDEGNRVQQVTQVNKSPEQEPERDRGMGLTQPSAGDVSHLIKISLDDRNTELQSNQTEAGTALAMAMAALYYRFVGALPHHLQLMTISGQSWVTCSFAFWIVLVIAW